MLLVGGEAGGECYRIQAFFTDRMIKEQAWICAA